jgi:hypothetical protein
LELFNSDDNDGNIINQFLAGMTMRKQKTNELAVEIDADGYEFFIIMEGVVSVQLPKEVTYTI